VNFVEHKKSGGYIHINLSGAAASIFDQLAMLGAKAMIAAERRAINKTLNWLKTHTARTISAEERIALKAVRQRLRVYPIKGGCTKGKMWLGLNPIEASRIGRVSPGKSGVSVAGRRYAGAFYKEVYQGQKDIWIRKASQHYDPALYFPQKSRGGWIEDELKHRFPVVKAKVEIEAARKHFDRWLKDAEARLLVVLQQEVNYEIQKVVGRAR